MCKEMNYFKTITLIIIIIIIIIITSTLYSAYTMLQALDTKIRRLAESLKSVVSLTKKVRL